MFGLCYYYSEKTENNDYGVYVPPSKLPSKA